MSNITTNTLVEAEKIRRKSEQGRMYQKRRKEAKMEKAESQSRNISHNVRLYIYKERSII